MNSSINRGLERSLFFGNNFEKKWVFMSVNQIDVKSLSNFQKRANALSLFLDHPYVEIINRLLERLDYIKISPKKILTVGPIIAPVKFALQNRFKEAAIIEVEAGCTIFQNLEDSSIDFVFLHFALFSTNSPKDLIASCHRVLRQEGLFLFMDCGPDAFAELRYCFSKIDQQHHFYHYYDMHDVGDWLKKSYFSDPVMDRDDITFHYKTIKKIIDDLRKIGLMNAYENRSRGLISTQKWSVFENTYERLKQEGYYPVTLELICGHGWKAMPPDQKNEFYVNVEDIVRRGVKTGG